MSALEHSPSSRLADRMAAALRRLFVGRAAEVELFRQVLLARRFFQQAAKTIAIAWQIAVGGDLRFPEVEGKRPPSMRIINWYLSKLHVAARHDPVVSRRFNDVTGLLAPPSSLMRPGTVLRVLQGNLRSVRPRIRALAAEVEG
ncbi:MAG: hypothetical protein KatS3mg057_0029 [Herpetosiphonaceae bacterium]|nr:MAG: hypothetical protein KatS3mg057_0029 [Herpetosiphonaceae bacterium]